MDGLNGQVIQKPKMFTYNVVFEHEAIQADILEHSGITRLLDMAMDGFSCTVFCYGQTGSGKTHTLTGPPQLVSRENMLTRPPHLVRENKGLLDLVNLIMANRGNTPNGFTRFLYMYFWFNEFAEDFACLVYCHSW